ncbi:LacI family DNA-binding transcriptional regulator [Candidatus Aerophobetes bacterium]|nr:LacI family DNA-binding transcriptional regulator [Candidatus Aerophobetes bacterium]
MNKDKSRNNATYNNYNSHLKRRKSNVTIKDVARRAGMSTSTVGRVVGGYGYVSDKTREKVRKAMKEMGYYPNVIARSLKTRRTQTIAYLVPSITNPFFSQIAASIEDLASSHGYNLILCNAGIKADKLRKITTMLLENRIAGLIHSLPSTDALYNLVEIFQKTHIPIVSASGSRKFTEVDRVMPDDVQGAGDATQFLLELGHSYIAVLGVKNSTTSKLRTQGYKETLQRRGYKLNEELIVEGSDFGEDTGYTLMKVLLERKKPPTAVVAFNDVMAVGAIRAIEEEGLSIPEDISLIGFDDTIARLTKPSLTSIALPIGEIGKVAIRILLDRIEEKDSGEPKKILLGEKLVVRDSTARPPARSDL